MKNVTFSADEALIERARRRAAARHSTLNTEFRRWLEAFVEADNAVNQYDNLMARLSGIRAQGPYSRDELNAR